MVDDIKIINVDTGTNKEEQLRENFWELIKRGSDINALLQQIGHDPWWYRRMGIEEMLAKGADPNIIAMYAIGGQCYDSGALIRTLLEHGASCNRVVDAVLENDCSVLLIDHYRLFKEYNKHLDLGFLIYNGYIDYHDVLTNLDILEIYGVKIKAKKFAKMVARSKHCSYKAILAECGIR